MSSRTRPSDFDAIQRSGSGFETSAASTYQLVHYIGGWKLYRGMETLGMEVHEKSQAMSCHSSMQHDLWVSVMCMLLAHPAD